MNGVLDDGESQSSAAPGASTARGINLVESLENPLQVLRRNPDPGIFHNDADGIFRGQLISVDHLHAHASSGGCELDAVLNQILQDQVEQSLVGLEFARLLGVSQR